MLVHCPSCDAQMDPQAAACPICLRKRTRQEIFAGLRGEKGNRLGKASFGAGQVLLYLTLAASCAVYFFRHVEPSPSPVKARRMPVEEPQVESAPQPLPEPVIPPAAVLAPALPAAALPVAVPSTHWTFRGSVYDFRDLKPVAGVDVTLRDSSSGSTQRTKTDLRGSFSIKAPKITSGGYVIALAHARYRESYIEDSEPSLLTKDAAARRQTVGRMDEVPLLNILLPTAKEDEVSANYFLVPKGFR